jgi:hypothetical protein
MIPQLLTAPLQKRRRTSLSSAKAGQRAQMGRYGAGAPSARFPRAVNRAWSAPQRVRSSSVMYAGHFMHIARIAIRAPGSQSVLFTISCPFIRYNE